MVKKITAESGDLLVPEQGTDPATALKGLKQKWTDYMDLVHQIQAKAPAEIKVDVDFRAGQFENANARVQKLTGTSEAELATILGTDFNSPEASGHDARLETYETDNCGIDPNAD